MARGFLDAEPEVAQSLDRRAFDLRRRGRIKLRRHAAEVVERVVGRGNTREDRPAARYHPRPPQPEAGSNAEDRREQRERSFPSSVRDSSALNGPTGLVSLLFRPSRALWMRCESTIQGATRAEIADVVQH